MTKTSKLRFTRTILTDKVDAVGDYFDLTGVEFSPEVPVIFEYDHSVVLGTAKLKRFKKLIQAEFTLDKSAPVVQANMNEKDRTLELYPCVSGMILERDGNLILRAVISAISICNSKNCDRTIGPIGKLRKAK